MPQYELIYAVEKVLLNKPRIKIKYLIDVGVLLGICQNIKCCVQLVEETHNLHGASRICVCGAIVTEAHNS
jgi:hypothetical protein